MDQRSKPDDVTTFDTLLRAAAATPRLPGRPVRPGDRFQSGRFSVLRELGRGATGVVYEALDASTRSRIALKALAFVDAHTIYRLKREFRALVDLEHPNLVMPHALFEEDGNWFLAQELVRGEPFTRAVRPSGRIDLRMLRAVTRGLVAGVQALHAAGLVHRDLKPSNVLVSRPARARILDFGLIADLHASAASREASPRLGTPAYMAPEQAAGAEASPASDWYAVGVMLYEALTGRLPPAGSDPGRARIPPPALLASDVPVELDALCLRLLDSDPGARAAGDDILAALQPAGRRAASRTKPAPADPFVGRAGELRILHEALEQTRAGRSVVAEIHGPSGMGKSALVRRFLAQPALRDAVVLSGRCHESESVPFKALDGIVDALAAYLSQSSEASPAHALCRLFPALERVRGVQSGPSSELPREARELRRRAVTELARILQRIANDARVVVHIDDLQWGDLDSLDLLTQLLTTADPPVLLILLSYRSTDRSSSACLRRLGELDLGCTRRQLALTGLGADDVAELTERLGVRNHLSVQLRAECEGNPFLLLEAIRYSQSGTVPANASLAHALRARIAGASVSGMALLEAMAVAARPLTFGVAAHATGLQKRLRTTAASLRARRLVRLTPDGVEPYHDRIREAVHAALPPERERGWHERLALAYEQGAPSEVESIAAHWFQCGQTLRAVAHAEQAAQRAEHALAFDRAVTLYRLLLDRAPAAEAADRVRRLRKLGDALVDAARGAEAAQVYSDAAALAPEVDAAMLRAQAGGQWLLCGEPRAGTEALARALQDLGVELPSTAAETWRAGGELEFDLRARAVEYQPEQHCEAVEQPSRARADALFSIAFGVMTVDGMSPGATTLRQLTMWEALEVGDASLVARAAYMIGLANADVENHPELANIARFWIELAQRAAQCVDDPEVRAWALLVEGTRAGLAGKPAASTERCLEAERIFREQCRGRSREADMARFLVIVNLFNQCRLSELRSYIRLWLTDARQRGDSYLERRLELFDSEQLMADDCASARANVQRTLDRCPDYDDFAKWFAISVLIRIDLYEGCVLRAWQSSDLVWTRLSAYRVPIWTRLPPIPTRFLSHWCYERACCALAVMKSHDAAAVDAGKLMAAVDEAIECLEHLTIPKGARLGLLLAARNIQRLNRAAAVPHLQELLADPDCDDVYGMLKPIIHTAWGQLVGGEAGRARIAEADRSLRALGIRNPQAWMRMLGPTFEH